MIGGASVVAVVAMARNRVIGANGAMPWHLSGDLKRFRALTEGRPMIMGRRTLESIGRLLPGRDTIVVTRGRLEGFEGALVAHGPDEAASLALRCAERRGVREIVVAGGAQIYSAFLARTDRIELTVVEAEPEGDTVLAPFESGFNRIAQAAPVQGERDSVPYRTETWVRVASWA